VSQTLDLKAKGLYTFPSELSEVPQGALSLANNINIDKESIITPRRGVEKETYALANTNDRVDRIFEYQDTKIIQYNTDTLARDTGAAYTDYTGTFEAPEAGIPMRAVKSNQNFYFTTSMGLYKLDAIAGTPIKAGAPRGLTVELTLSGSSGFLETVGGDAVAYRVIWGYYDANDNLIVGAPSQRAIIASTGEASTKDVSVTITIPDNVTTSFIYQLYRSANTGDETIEPSDEMQLVYESSPTSGEITAGTITFIDATPEDLRGVTLYTSPSQETIAQANNEPPFARDIAVYKNHLFFGDTKQKQKLQLALLAAEGAAVTPDTSLKYDDAITINGVTYTGKAVTNVGSNQFKVFTGATPSQDIRDTAVELCKVINQSASNTGANAIYAYYISGADDTPGKILLESRSVGGAQFAVTFTPVVSGSNPWQPELPTSGTTVVSSNDTFSNGLYYSKPQEPEAVPEANVFRIGSADDKIKRILALRDSLFILKEDEGIFRLTGEDASSFRVEQFDQTAKIRAPETAVVLSNAIYALTDQGVVQITETGVSVISRPIEDQILELFGYGKSVVASYSYGIAYETERKYILASVSSSSDTAADQYFVYNTFTRAWTKWTGFSTAHGIVKTTDDKLYFADDISNYILKERKTNTNFDYADYRTTTTISAVSLDGLTLTLLNTDLMSVGDVVYQSATEFSLIESVDTVAGTVTLEYDGGIVAGAATVYGAIPVHIRWVPIHGGNPGVMKHFREVTYLFKRNFSIAAKAEFFSEISQVVEEVDLTGPTNGLFGFFIFGEIPFGGEIGRAPKRTYVPQQKQRCTQLNVGFIHAIGFSDFQLNGLSTIFNEMSERVAR
jgi:hypothetical protein